MTLRRTGFDNRGKPLRRASEKRLAEAGGFMLSTFRPKTPAGGVISGGRSSHPRVHRVPLDIDKIVKVRSKKECEIGPEGLEGCWGRGQEKHHRISQKAGGRHGAAARRSDRPSNILFLCVFCHLVVTNCPRWAYENGVSLRERQEPTAEPVLYRGEFSYLDDAGGVWSYEDAGA
jgi:hypothetical protein